MIELEKTYLAGSVPPGLEACKAVDITDTYIPASAAHPQLRLRQRGNTFEITKKMPLGHDASQQQEQTIALSREEFAALAGSGGKTVRKRRYFYPWNGRRLEVDVFQGPLQGLVLVDVEFRTNKEKATFQHPDFCLADVTHEPFAAGGMLCGKSYRDIGTDFARFGYVPLFIK